LHAAQPSWSHEAAPSIAAALHAVALQGKVMQRAAVPEQRRL
jgi:hypothetical protein